MSFSSFLLTEAYESSLLSFNTGYWWPFENEDVKRWMRVYTHVCIHTYVYIYIYMHIHFTHLEESETRRNLVMEHLYVKCWTFLPWESFCSFTPLPSFATQGFSRLFFTIARQSMRSGRVVLFATVCDPQVWKHWFIERKGNECSSKASTKNK